MKDSIQDTKANAMPKGRSPFARRTSDSTPMPAQTPIFQLEEASFAISGHCLLEQISVLLPSGQVIGLIGHNGSGKSTLLKILARQEQASSGSIRFAGRALESWGTREFARKLAYLPQSLPASTGMLVKELVALGRFPWHGALGRIGAAGRQNVEEAISLTDMVPLAERSIDTLSGGERQRAWLAMLLAQDADCLLLDEPISALDLRHQIEVLSLIRRLSLTRRLSVIVVLHDINMAARYCDEIVALKAGRLIAQGPVASIMDPAVLKAIFGLEMQVIDHPEGRQYLAFPR